MTLIRSGFLALRLSLAALALAGFTAGCVREARPHTPPPPLTHVSATPRPTNTPQPTNTPMPTPTETPRPTNTPQPTNTPMPTPTETPTPIVLDDFAAEMAGVGEHGNMIEVNYQGDAQDLEGLTISGSISQGNQVIEQSVPLQTIGGKLCFEMLDAKYRVGSPVTLEISVEGEGEPINNGRQEILLDDFALRPFLGPLFFQSEVGPLPFVDNNHADHWQYPFYAHDYWYGNGIRGTPVHMPFSFIVLKVVEQQGFETEDPTVRLNWTLNLYSPYTGFVCDFQHQQPGELIRQIVGNDPMNLYGPGWPPSGPIIEYDPDRILSNFGPKDAGAGNPHLHLACQIPDPGSSNFPSYYGWDSCLCYALCPDNQMPCEGNPNIEIEDLYVSSVVDTSR